MIIKNLNFSFGTSVIFNNVNLIIDSNDKVGIVGVNGAGKTTLFKLLLKELEPNSGSITLGKNIRVSLLPQIIDTVDSEEIVFDYLLGARPIKELQNKLAILYEEAALEIDSKKQDKILKEIGNINNRLDYFEQYNAENILLKIISGMNISTSLLDMKVKQLSGGQKSKIAFARLLYSKPEIILLDEPTNHLDESSRNFVIDYLKNYKASVLVISHDISFLDAITNKTLFIDKRIHNMILYDGNYTKYLKVKKANDDALEKKAAMQNKEIERLEKVISLYTNSSGKRKKMAQDREKKLQKLYDNKIELLDDYKKVKFDIKIDEESGKFPLIVSNIDFSYNSKVKLIRNLSFTLNKGEKFLIMGENGVGKSTLLKLIMNLLEPINGSITKHYKTKIAYYAQEQESLDLNKSIIDNFIEYNASEKEIRACLSKFLFVGDDVYKIVSSLSPGERARVCLAKISLSGANLIILDEPTNHLDPETQEIIADIFKKYQGTMLVVSHNKHFIKNLNIDRVLLLPSGKIKFYDDKVVE